MNIKLILNNLLSLMIAVSFSACSSRPSASSPVNSPKRSINYPAGSPPAETMQVKLTASDEIGGAAWMGYSIALSADGSVMAVGGPYDSGNIGAVWIYTFSQGSGWTEQTKIVPTDEGGNSDDNFGVSVALSSDGNTLAVAGPNYTGDGSGGVWIYSHSNNQWTEQTKIIPDNVVGTNADLAYTAISVDGNTLVIGGRTDNAGVGAVWIYTRSGSSWTQQTKIIPTDELNGPSNFGGAVSINADATTLAVGGSSDNGDIGATWIYTYSPQTSTWREEAKIIPSDVGKTPGFGWVVALSADGNTLVASGAEDTIDTTPLGAFWIYTRTGGIWVEQLKVVQPTSNQLGAALAISADGSKLVVGAPFAGAYNTVTNTNPGEVWVYSLSSNSCSSGTQITVSDDYNHEGATFGSAVALSSNGSVMAAGGAVDNNHAGAAWVFH